MPVKRYPQLLFCLDFLFLGSHARRGIATINPHMSVDVQRTYYFNYSNLRWSPHFVIQVLQ